jgi:uncharacterized membrane protein
MVPPPIPDELWVIHLTGLLEIAGAIGLLLPKGTRLAGICLCLFLLARFPAKVYAALNAIQFRGEPPTDIGLRALVQVIFLTALWWSAVAPKPISLKARPVERN